MDLRARTVRRTLLLAAAICIAPNGMSSRNAAAQATAAGSSVPGLSRVDIFGTYSYLHPHDSDIYGQQYTPLTTGFSAGLTGYFSRSFGVEGQYTKFYNSPDYCFATAQGGLVVRHQWGRVVPFAEALGGGAQVGPSYAHNGAANACKWGWGVEGGAGLDYVLPAPALRNHLAIRPIEGDYQFTSVNFGAQTAPNTYTGGVGQIYAYKLSAGLVYRIGDMQPPLPASMACEVQPVSVYAGDPITVTGSVENLAKRKATPTYTWTTSGGKLSRANGGATIATGGLAAGDYAVTGKVSEGIGADENAECSASFRVMAYEPPTVSCSANPTTVLPGGVATITASGRSPQNRALSFSYGASEGQITGSGTTATLSAADVPPGTIHVTCNVVDDAGNSASAKTAVTVSAPPQAAAQPAPQPEKMCSISFERDRRRPVRVDNEAKACLDDIALEMNRQSDAVLVVVGKHDPTEKPEAAAERTLNVKQYLSQEKGIDPNRIEVRTGETTGRTVDNILVPPGATWDTEGTTSFDPATVPRHGQPYAPTKH